MSYTHVYPDAMKKSIEVNILWICLSQIHVLRYLRCLQLIPHSLRIPLGPVRIQMDCFSPSLLPPPFTQASSNVAAQLILPHSI